MRYHSTIVIYPSSQNNKNEILQNINEIQGLTLMGFVQKQCNVLHLLIKSADCLAYFEEGVSGGGT